MVAMSHMEADYMTLSDAICEFLSRIYYITEFGISTMQQPSCSQTTKRWPTDKAIIDEQRAS
jgi:hypothetical protein